MGGNGAKADWAYRGRKEIAIEAGEYLKQMQAQNEVTVRDIRDNSITVIEKEKSVVLDLRAAVKASKQ
jgi:hypothetical protein